MTAFGTKRKCLECRAFFRSWGMADISWPGHGYRRTASRILGAPAHANWTDIGGRAGHGYWKARRVAKALLGCPQRAIPIGQRWGGVGKYMSPTLVVAGLSPLIAMVGGPLVVLAVAAGMVA